MITVRVHARDGGVTQVDLPDLSVIGKAAQCELVLRGWFVAREHARLIRHPGSETVIVEDLGGGVQINGVRISHQCAWQPEESLEIAGYRLLRLPLPSGEEAVSAAASNSLAMEAPVAAASTTVADSQTMDWRFRLHDLLLQRIDLRRTDISGMSDAELRAEAERMLRDLLRELRTELPEGVDQESLLRQVLDEAVGLGPLEQLLADDAVTEIMVNRHDEIFVEMRGRLVRYPMAFSSNQAVMAVIERVVAPIGRRIDESSPMVDARLRDGSRVNAIIPPLALKGPALTIRKFARKRLAVEDLVGFGSLSPEMAEFLRVCVLQKRNVVVSGGTGSGKTTLLNVLSNFIPEGERIVTIEDAAELQLNHEHLVSLESRPANSEGKGQIAIRDLVRNSLRMRPDRIVIGECRGAEAMDMLQAMNTGHEGSLTTLHANTPRDAIARMETLVMMAGMDLPLTAIREQIASAVDIIVQQTRFACGTRMITYITEITGMEAGRIQLQDIFRFQKGVTPAGGRTSGTFMPGELIPAFYEELMGAGVAVNLDLFKPPVAAGARTC
jgi:pilus assembly protein CpaF